MSRIFAHTAHKMSRIYALAAQGLHDAAAALTSRSREFRFIKELRRDIRYGHAVGRRGDAANQQDSIIGQASRISAGTTFGTRSRPGTARPVRQPTSYSGSAAGRPAP
jgi:hypothetical protein